MHHPRALDSAHEALRLAEAAPADAVALAAATVRRARRSGDAVACAVAERAWGLALRQRGDLGGAVVHLQRGVRCAEQAGDDPVAAEARLTLAYSLAERGRAEQALDEVDTALAALADGPGRARALAQRGGILLDLGRHAEALDHYRRAFPALRAAGDTLWIYRVVCNRGLAHAYRHEFAAAETDLRHAEQLAEELGLALAVGFARANLAFVLGLRGETGAAFAYSSAAEGRIREHGGRVGELLADRGELLLSVRLVGEARATAARAVTEFAREGRGLKLPEARLLLAEAALLDGEPAAGLPHARQAAREFARQHRPEWAALARLVVLRARCADGGDGRRRPRRRRDRRRRCAPRGGRPRRWTPGSSSRRCCAAAEREEAAEHLREAARARRTGPAMLRARGWYAEALARDDAGNPRGARTAIRTGLRLLDEHRAALGATDVRAHAAGHRTALAELGLRIALRSGWPREVLEWAERGRATGLLMQRSGRPPDDPETADVLAELRGTVAEIAELRGGRPGRRGRAPAGAPDRPGTADPGAVAAPRRGGDPLAPPAGVDALAAALGDAGLLELVDADGTLVAVTLAGGRPRLHRIGPMRAADDLLDRVAFAVSRLLRPDLPAALHGGAATLLRDGVARADAALLQPDARARRPAAGRRARPGRCRTCRGRCCRRARDGRSRSRPRRRCGSAPGPGPPTRGTPSSPPARRCPAPTPRRGPSPPCTASPRCWPPTRPPSGCCGRSTAPPSCTWPRTAASPRTTRCSPSSRWPTGRCSPTTSSSSPTPRTRWCSRRARAGGPWCAPATSCSVSARCSSPAGRASSWRPRCRSRTPRPRR